MPIYKMKGKKDGKQRYRVRINYKDEYGNPKQRERVVYGSEEAKDLERKLLEEIKQTPIEKKITLQQLYDEYIEVKKYEVRESTIDKTKRVLSYHVLPSLKNTRIDKLALTTLQKWKTEMEEKNLSLKTKQNVYGDFNALLNYAVKMEYISSNPLKKLGNFKSSYVEKKKISFYTPEEFKRFITEALSSAQEENTITAWDFYVFFNIAFFTGMRKGEIHGLKWSDINNDILHVERSITQKVKGGDRETPPKNRSSIRSLQLPDPLIKILNQHKERYSRIDGFSEDWRVCGGLVPLRDTSIQNANKRFAKSAGLKTLRIHDFRHSHASLLANEGINIQEIARRLGHSKIEITWNTYSHLYPREEERAISILNKIV